MTIIVLDGQGGGIGRAIISALLPLLPQGAQLLCVGTNAMATAAMLKAGAQRGATGENAVRWAAQNADILIAPRPWPRAREALAFLHNLWLDVAFILPYNKGAEARRASERAGRRQPFRTRLNITPFSIRRHAKTRNE